MFFKKNKSHLARDAYSQTLAILCLAEKVYPNTCLCTWLIANGQRAVIETEAMLLKYISLVHYSTSYCYPYKFSDLKAFSIYALFYFQYNCRIKSHILATVIS